MFPLGCGPYRAEVCHQANPPGPGGCPAVTVERGGSVAGEAGTTYSEKKVLGREGSCSLTHWTDLQKARLEHCWAAKAPADLVTVFRSGWDRAGCHCPAAWSRSGSAGNLAREGGEAMVAKEVRAG
jgi:hypothetical protein